MSLKTIVNLTVLTGLAYSLEAAASDNFTLINDYDPSKLTLPITQVAEVFIDEVVIQNQGPAYDVVYPENESEDEAADPLSYEERISWVDRNVKDSRYMAPESKFSCSKCYTKEIMAEKKLLEVKK